MDDYDEVIPELIHIPQYIYQYIEIAPPAGINNYLFKSCDTGELNHKIISKFETIES
jgi:hypothetical protein